MKKRICVLLIICIMVSICGCGKISIFHEVKEIKLDSSVSSVVTKDGKLLMWGLDYGDKLKITRDNDGINGYSTKPIEILDNVKEFDMKSGLCSAVKKNNALYIWGIDHYYRTENGTVRSPINTPYKVLDNVRNIEVGNDFVAAMTEDDTLYIFGEYVAENKDEFKELIKIDNVKEISLGNEKNAAVTNAGDLYIWDNSFKTMKVLDNVKRCSVQDDYICVMKSDNTFLISDDIDEKDNGEGYELKSPKEIVLFDENYKVIQDEKISKVYVEEYMEENIVAGIITENNNLYISNTEYHTYYNVSARKVMENVRDIKVIDGSIEIIDQEDTLYLMDKEMVDAYISPVKVMENVEDYIVEPHYDTYLLVLTKNGILYRYKEPILQDNGFEREEPDKILDDVISIASGRGYYGAITKNNHLYMFGDNDYGQVGNGKQSNDEIVDKPVKVL